MAVLYVFYVIPVTLLYLVLSADAVTSYATWISKLYRHVSLVLSCVFVFYRPLVISPIIRGIRTWAAYQSRNNSQVVKEYTVGAWENIRNTAVFPLEILNFLTVKSVCPQNTFSIL